MIWHSFATILHNADKMQKNSLEDVTLHGDQIKGFLNDWDLVVMFFGGVFPDIEWSYYSENNFIKARTLKCK